jgi:hypothetical protein
MASMPIRHVDEGLHTRFKASTAAPLKAARQTSPVRRMIRLTAEWLQPTAAQGGKIQC